jgi:hypothetical protein
MAEGINVLYSQGVYPNTTETELRLSSIAQTYTAVLTTL